ncbi:hypothetical protein ACFQ4K_07450 [Tistrella bauzanensis]
MAIDDGMARVEPFVDWRRLDFVRILLGTEFEPARVPEPSPALPVPPTPAPTSAR